MGRDGMVMTNQGGSWRRVDIGLGTDDHINGLWSADGTGDPLWFAANGGQVIRRQGAGYQDMNAPTSQDLNGIFGQSAGDVWVVGDAGTVLRHNGSSWSTLDIGTGIELRAGLRASASDVWTGNSSVSGTPDGTVWIGGHDGAYTTPRVHHTSGVNMVSVPYDGSGSVTALIALANDEVWAGAGNGGLMRCQP